MDGFMAQLLTTDTRTKLALGVDIITFLENEENSLECSDIGQFIDGLVPWLGSSNFKVGNPNFR
jgi:CLIP-associating protein 1/2